MAVNVLKRQVRLDQVCKYSWFLIYYIFNVTNRMRTLRYFLVLLSSVFNRPSNITFSWELLSSALTSLE